MKPYWDTSDDLRFGSHECIVCGKEYAPVNPNQKYCGYACASKGSEPDGLVYFETSTCGVCGREFVGDDGKALVCSPECHRREKIDRAEVMATLVVRDGMRCGFCGNEIASLESSDVQIDHIIPRSRGGSSSVGNLQLTHPKCNMKKGTSSTRVLQASPL